MATIFSIIGSNNGGKDILNNRLLRLSLSEGRLKITDLWSGNELVITTPIVKVEPNGNLGVDIITLSGSHYTFCNVSDTVNSISKIHGGSFATTAEVVELFQRAANEFEPRTVAEGVMANIARGETMDE